MYQKKFLYLLLLGFLFASCKHHKRQQADNAKPDSTAMPLYANGFYIDYFPHYKRVTVINPWVKNTIYARYYLVANKKIDTPKDGQKIQVPLHAIGSTSGTQFEFLHLIGELNSITGVCSPKLIYNKELLDKFSQGKLTDLGDPFSLNIERVELLHPDAVIISGFNQEDPISKRLIENGTPVIFDNEWTEKSILARAEWIKFIAAFYNKEHLADSLYAVTVTNYNRIKDTLNVITYRPTVMSGGNFKGTWYMPGGKSYMANLLIDAGANYYYSFDTTEGSLPLNFEVVLKNFRQTEIWIGSSANSMNELLSTDERNNLFNAVKNKQVYNFNKRTTPSGGNDFWESGTAHPDVILEDMIKIFHPELMLQHQFVYVEKLK